MSGKIDRQPQQKTLASASSKSLVRRYKLGLGLYYHEFRIVQWVFTMLTIFPVPLDSIDLSPQDASTCKQVQWC